MSNTEHRKIKVGKHVVVYVGYLTNWEIQELIEALNKELEKRDLEMEYET